MMMEVVMSNRETSASIAQWGAETFGEVADLTVLTQRARIEFEELEHAVRAGDVDEIGREAADVMILLHRLVGLVGKDLASEVDAKMQINRARRWRLSGDGVGQHE
ncbi:hypothetical protein U91I_02154 [alpha proteobacterium U9-1i]|nr:hypothetical protein U91I_02154 [alpha proteobacterium U9-1i]